jgi:hypothetical protein
MDCAERERLRWILSIALQELVYLYEELTRVPAVRVTDSGPGRFESELLPKARQHQREAANNYSRHVAQHACGDHLEIGSLLQEQLNVARIAHLAASVQFDLLAKDTRSGIPQLDGSLAIQKAGKERSAALQRYMLALKQLTDYTLTRQWPADLRPPE